MQCVISSGNGQGSIAYLIALDGSNKTGYVYDVGNDVSQCEIFLLNANEYNDMATYGSMENIDKELLGEYFLFFFTFTLIVWVFAKGLGIIIKAVKNF